LGLVLPEFEFEPITSKVEGSKCVPVVLDMKGIYNVYVGKDTTRRYKQEQLPSFILSKIIIAKELSTNPKLKSIYSIPSKYQLFTCPEDGVETIAWKISDSIYVIVLSEKELSKIKGTRIDTRKKSQSKSKTNS
jgi:hypothetical protein